MHHRCQVLTSSLLTPQTSPLWPTLTDMGTESQSAPTSYVLPSKTSTAAQATAGLTNQDTTWVCAGSEQSSWQGFSSTQAVTLLHNAKCLLSPQASWGLAYIWQEEHGWCYINHPSLPPFPNFFFLILHMYTLHHSCSCPS